MSKSFDTSMKIVGAMSGDAGAMIQVGGTLFESVFDELKRQRERKIQQDLEDLLAELDQARPGDTEIFSWHRDRLEDPVLAEMVARTFERLRTTYDAGTRYSMARLTAEYYVSRKCPDEPFRRCARFLERMGTDQLAFSLELVRHALHELESEPSCTIELVEKRQPGAPAELQLKISKAKRTRAEDIDPFRATKTSRAIVADVARELRQCGLADQPPIGGTGVTLNQTSVLFQKDAHYAGIALLERCLVPKSV